MTLQNTERHDPYAALHYRDFRLLLTGRFLTSFGNEMLTFAIGWELWLRTHQPFVLGMVGLVQVIPVVLLSLPAGHVADQYNLCVVSMFALFAGWASGGQWSFAIALILMIVSLGFSLRELFISVRALDLLLTDLEEHEKAG